MQVEVVGGQDAEIEGVVVVLTLKRWIPSVHTRYRLAIEIEYQGL